jgi:two-component system cell cycle sensor histidine kinase/response regulator CckA
VKSAKKTEAKGNKPAGKSSANRCQGNTRAIAGGIAHDLNTILTVIYGYCELALESVSESSGAEHNIRRIIGATDRAKMLTDELIDLGRDLVQQKEKIKVSEILSDTVKFLKPSLPDTITVAENIKTPDICVEAVPAQLFRVFMNLSANAFQAMEGTGGSLTVTLDTAEESGNINAPGSECVHIRFEDTGKGMNEETARNALKPFFTSGKGSRGTGLGLAVVNEIITAMDGTVKISSGTSKGTIIDILIPASPFGSVGEKI